MSWWKTLCSCVSLLVVYFCSTNECGWHRKNSSVYFVVYFCFRFFLFASLRGAVGMESLRVPSLQLVLHQGGAWSAWRTVCVSRLPAFCAVKGFHRRKNSNCVSRASFFVCGRVIKAVGPRVSFLAVFLFFSATWENIDRHEQSCVCRLTGFFFCNVGEIGRHG